MSLVFLDGLFLGSPSWIWATSSVLFSPGVCLTVCTVLVEMSINFKGLALLCSLLFRAFSCHPAPAEYTGALEMESDESEIRYRGEFSLDSSTIFVDHRENYDVLCACCGSRGNGRFILVVLKVLLSFSNELLKVLFILFALLFVCRVGPVCLFMTFASFSGQWAVGTALSFAIFRNSSELCRTAGLEHS